MRALLPKYDRSSVEGAHFTALDEDIRIRAFLVGVVDAGEAGELAGACFGIETFRISPLALVDRCSDVDLDERQIRLLMYTPGEGRPSA